MTMSSLSALSRAMGAARLAVGASALLAPGRAARLVGFPNAHDNPTARVMGRFSGVRDLLLGALLVDASRSDAGSRARTISFNALVDVGDLATLAVHLVQRQGIARAALLSTLFALPGPAVWLATRARAPIW